MNSRFVTIAASHHHSQESLLHHIYSHISHRTNNILIVGGNEKHKQSTSTPTVNEFQFLSSSEAISVIQEHFYKQPSCSSQSQNNPLSPTPPPKIWCVWNPNKEEQDDNEQFWESVSLSSKISAGASGVITQPILTQRGWENLEYVSSTLPQEIDLIVGVAFPPSIKSLLFWAQLIDIDINANAKKDHLKNEYTTTMDPLWMDHLEYFSQSDFDACMRRKWIVQHQRDPILSCGRVNGVHLMPFGNISDLPLFLQNANEQ